MDTSVQGKAIRGVVFDFDGVLFDSLTSNLAYYNRVFRAMGAPEVTLADKEKVRICHTSSSPGVFDALLGEERRDAALAYARQLDYHDFIPLMRLMPDVIPALRRLRERVKLAVATNRDRSTQGILQYFAMEEYFQAIVTLRDVHRPKPDPEMLFVAAQRLELDVSEMIYVGDALSDRQAAEAAGMRFVDYRGTAGGGIRIMSHLALPLLVEGKI